MLVKEYRILLPMTVEEYRIAQLYMIQAKSRFSNRGYAKIGIDISDRDLTGCHAVRRRFDPKT
ncbi:hypothetical protein DICVIV_09416 [Dictyocaulus viviparus]|uniref:Phosphatidylinositol transfer protein N-terminal domain-containing protein n=1 Tax=Dictyocaulus viviparus TaxID=29172 RepID=A0A0D8XQA0_DICVI|nr:hypothetical protein DICVIV_09416 [Dictyocaulus viviparus]